MQFLRRILGRLWPSGRASGVRTAGRESLVVTVAGRSYWVHTQFQAGPPPEYLVWTSDIRDITEAASVVAAPPAAAEVVPEVRRRLHSYFSAARARARFR